MEGHPGGERGAVHAEQRAGDGGRGRVENDEQQRVHDSETERRRPGHAVPEPEADEQHLGAARAEAAAGAAERDAQSQVEGGRGRGGGLSGVRGDRQELGASSLYVTHSECPDFLVVEFSGGFVARPRGGIYDI